jgi:hypothetical protein
VRQALFGCPDPPFSDDEEMRKWIHDQIEAEARVVGKSETRPVFSADGAQLSGAWQFSFLEWVGPGDWVERTHVIAGGRLDRLRAVSEFLASGIGCRPCQAVGHILTGGSVMVLPFEYEIHVGSAGTAVTVRTNFPWVQASLAAYAYRQARKEAREKWRALKGERARPSPVAAKVQAFLAPRQGRDRWDVLKEWNQTNPDNRYDHWRFLYRMCY